MITMTPQSHRPVRVAAQALGAGLAGWAAPFLFFLAMGFLVRHGAETLGNGAFSGMAAPIAVGLVTGLVVGALLGLLFAPRARTVALGAGVVQLVLIMSSGVYAETLICALAIGAGLVLGPMVAGSRKRA